ncbi:MAG: hypothetical protein Q9187_006297, partial [Circinaria calcarea]
MVTQLQHLILLVYLRSGKVTQLEDGSFVCSDHYLSYCGKCYVDFDDLNEGQDSGDDDDADEAEDDETDGSTEDESPEMAQSSSKRRCRRSPSSNHTPMQTVRSGYAALKYSSTDRPTSRSAHATRLSTPSPPCKIGRFYPPSFNDTPQSLFGPGHSPSPGSS